MSVRTLIHKRTPCIYTVLIQKRFRALLTCREPAFWSADHMRYPTCKATPLLDCSSSTELSVKTKLHTVCCKMLHSQDEQPRKSDKKQEMPPYWCLTQLTPPEAGHCTRKLSLQLSRAGANQAAGNTCQRCFCDSQALQNVQIIRSCLLHGLFTAGLAPCSCLCQRIAPPTYDLHSGTPSAAG